jgi:hypothetical protein
VLALSVVLPGRARLRQQLLFALLVGVPLLAYVATFVLSAWTPYMAHVDSALPRLMEHLAPLAILAIAIAVPGPALDGYLRRWTRGWLLPARV